MPEASPTEVTSETRTLEADRQSFGSVIKVGPLNKRSRKHKLAVGWRIRHFHLYNGHIRLFRQQFDDSPKEVVDLTGCSIHHEPGTVHLELTGPATMHQMNLKAASPEIAAEWKDAFELAINSHSTQDTSRALQQAEIEIGEIKRVIHQLAEKQKDYFLSDLSVKVIGAFELPAANKSTNTSDAYAVIRLGQTEHRTNVAKKQLSPVWEGTTMQFPRSQVNTKLEVTVYDYGRSGKGKCLGKCQVELDTLFASGVRQEVSQPFPLVPSGAINMKLSIAEAEEVSPRQNQHLTASETLKSMFEQLKNRIDGADRSAEQSSASLGKLRKELFDTFGDDYLRARAGNYRFKVTMVEARNLKAADANGFSDPYCRIKVRKGTATVSKFQSHVVDQSLNPRWESSIILEANSPAMSIVFSVYDHDKIGADDFLGCAEVSVADLLGENKKEFDEWLPLKSANLKNAAQGDLHIRIVDVSGQVTSNLKQKSSDDGVDLPMAQAIAVKEHWGKRLLEMQEQLSSLQSKYDGFCTTIHETFIDEYQRFCATTDGYLHVEICEVHGLPSANDSYFVEIIVGDKTHKSSVQENKEGNVAWDEGFDLPVVLSDGDCAFHLMKYDTMGRHTRFGKGIVGISSLSDQQPRSRRVELDQSKGVILKIKLQFMDKAKAQQKSRAKLSHSSLNYTPLVDLLFGDGGQSTLIPFLESVDAADMDALAKPVIRSAISNEADQGLLLGLIEREVAQTLSEGTLFRRNSPATKLCSAYAKEVGLDWLQEKLAKPLSDIINGPILELDPSRIGDQSHSVEQNADALKHAVLAVMNAVFDWQGAITLAKLKAKKSDAETSSSIEIYLPSEIRQVSTILWDAIKDRFPNSRRIVTAGFVFLRYIVPAVTAPDGFGIVDCKVSTKGRRNLVLVSKVVQNMANGVPFGQKEPYMQPMNEFVSGHLDAIGEFLDACSVQPQSLEKAQSSTSGNTEELTTDYAVIHVHLSRSMDKLQASNSTIESVVGSLLAELGPPPQDALDIAVADNEMAPGSILERTVAVKNALLQSQAHSTSAVLPQDKLVSMFQSEIESLRKENEELKAKLSHNTI